jgi:hypothetical protein
LTDGAMMTPVAIEQRVHIPVRALAGSAALVAVGSAIAITGVAVGVGAVAVVARDWVHRREQLPPGAVRHKWRQLSSAATAGRQAWRSPGT